MYDQDLECGFYGRVTISNSEGTHRTFQIRLQAKDAKFAPGASFVSLLTGPDNTSDYTGFAFVSQGRVNVWRSKRKPEFLYYAKMVEEFLGCPHDERLILGEREYWVSIEKLCAICGRTLTTPESIERGVGPVCMEKV